MYHGNRTIVNILKNIIILFYIWLEYGDHVCLYFPDSWPVPSVVFLWENATLPNAALSLTPHYSYSLVRLSNPCLLLKNAVSSTE